MSDNDKLRIRPLDENSDYSLWKIRIEAACGFKGLSVALQHKPHEESGIDETMFAEAQSQESHVIVQSISDGPLRILRSSIRNPFQMIQKLDQRYYSKSKSYRIKMSELLSLWYTPIDDDIGKHVDKIAGVIDQL